MSDAHIFVSFLGDTYVTIVISESFERDLFYEKSSGKKTIDTCEESEIDLEVAAVYVNNL